MSSGLEIRICTLNKIVTSGEPHAAGVINPVGDTDRLAGDIVGLEFEGAFVQSDLTNLRDKLNVMLGAGFPGTDVLVISAAKGLTGEAIELAARRALAVKNFLLSVGVPAANVAADMPSPYLRPTNAG